MTNDPFIVYTSNIFAILGLRSLYFLLAGVMGKFVYLKLGLSAVLVFVGVKMTLADLYKIPGPASLGVIAALLAVSIAASLVSSARPLREPGGKAGMPAVPSPPRRRRGELRAAGSRGAARGPGRR